MYKLHIPHTNKAPPRTQRRGAYLALLFYFQPLDVKAVGTYRVDGAALAQRPL